jgi:hypothetical protein
MGLVELGREFLQQGLSRQRGVGVVRLPHPLADEAAELLR